MTRQIFPNFQIENYYVESREISLNHFSDFKIFEISGQTSKNFRFWALRVYLGSSNNSCNINSFRLRFGLWLEAFGWHRFKLSDFKILCTLSKYSPLYLKAVAYARGRV